MTSSASCRVSRRRLQPFECLKPDACVGEPLQKRQTSTLEFAPLTRLAGRVEPHRHGHLVDVAWIAVREHHGRAEDAFGEQRGELILVKQAFVKLTEPPGLLAF